jgi:hypothetical protein
MQREYANWRIDSASDDGYGDLESGDASDAKSVTGLGGLVS